MAVHCHVFNEKLESILFDRTDRKEDFNVSIFSKKNSYPSAFKACDCIDELNNGRELLNVTTTDLGGSNFTGVCLEAKIPKKRI
ncbi:unnamed protein product [Urochloa humidicola]